MLHRLHTFRRIVAHGERIILYYTLVCGAVYKQEAISKHSNVYHNSLPIGKYPLLDFHCLTICCSIIRLIAIRFISIPPLPMAFVSLEHSVQTLFQSTDFVHSYHID